MSEVHERWTGTRIYVHLGLNELTCGVVVNCVTYLDSLQCAGRYWKTNLQNILADVTLIIANDNIIVSLLTTITFFIVFFSLDGSILGTVHAQLGRSTERGA